MAPGPNRLLWSLLRIVSSKDAATATVGDICEELDERMAAGRAPRRPGVWVNVQTVRAIGSATVARAPRLLRSTALILRDALRALRAAPAQSLFIVGVLAVGVTAATVSFSVVDAVVLKPLPVERPEQLVNIPTRTPDFKERITPELYWRLRDELGSVDSLAARTTWSGSMVTVGSRTDQWTVINTTSDIFRILRLTPVIGRLWTADDEARGNLDVAVLGYRLWREQFDGDASILGEKVSVDERSFRIVGVLSETSDHPEFDLPSTPIWLPRIMPRSGPADPFGIIARMRPGVTPAQVATDVERIAGIPGWRPDVTPLLDQYVAPVRRWMLIALGAALLVVLVASANAANLMLTRSAGRVQELAIRASLGASRRRIAMTVLTEGLLLSLGATALALVFAIAGVGMARVAVTTLLVGVFRAATISLNGRVLAAALATAIATGLICSLVPAWQTSRAPVSTLLKDADAPGPTRRRWRSAFLVAEVASVGVLLVVSWLFVVSLIRVLSIDLGIDREYLIAVKPRLEFQGTVDEVQQLIQRVPGVSDVAVSTVASLPLVGRAFGGAWITTILTSADGSFGPDVAPVTALEYRVTPNYFEVAGVRFLRGGTWSADLESSSSVVILDERAARQLFGAADPIGRPVRAARPDGVFTVIGVVPHVYARGPEETNPPSAYFALRPNPTRNFAGLFVKTSRPPAEILPLVTAALKPVAPVVKDPFVFVADEAVSRITATRRFTAGLMSAFGLVGILIGAAGIYAVMASFVAQQYREIGVRLALGATPARIQRGVLALAWRHLLAGLVIGLPIAWWVSRGFAALLFDVTPADASVYVGVSALLCAAGFLAAWVPARRAARVDPIISLRR